MDEVLRGLKTYLVGIQLVDFHEFIGFGITCEGIRCVIKAYKNLPPLSVLFNAPPLMGHSSHF